MMAKGATTLAQPYKFLDYYGFEDRHIFFGREKETETLLSDVISTRLVVLFAKTGSGKTSLINAGVRPRLEELDYVTFYTRVERDPTESVRKALREENLLSSELEGQSLATQLERAVMQLDKPIVVFFDQFEEFFIYIFNEDPEKAHQFISDIARVYRNHYSGVHIVFSMREEFFVEMNAFYNAIPSIFRNVSHLRLYWFNEDQARDAIVLPAQRFGVEIEAKLVDRLISDLAEDQRIEPARFQIVCDTLWRQRADGRILLADYERLGGAKRILDRRLEEDIDQNLGDGQLRLFEKLLPKLSTEPGTKYIRGFDELVETLRTDADSLGKLLNQLKKIRLIRESTRYGALYVEWTSDYLAERTDYLQRRVRAISLRRLLKAAMDKADELKDEQALELLKVALQQPTLGPQTFEALEEEIEGAIRLLERSLQQDALALLAIDVLRQMGKKGIMKAVDLLETVLRQEGTFALRAGMELNRIAGVLTDDEEDDSSDLPKLAARQAKAVLADVLADRAEPLFLQALEQGLDMRFWFEKASENGVEVWEILREKIVNRDVPIKQAENAVRLLSMLGTGRALELLEIALRQDTLAELTVTILDQMESEEVVELWESLLQQDYLVLQAQRALERISESRTAKPQVVDRARSVLDKWRQDQGIAQPRRAPRVKRGRLPPQTLEDRAWDSLLRRIKDGNCTPFLGAGACAGFIPLGSEIAQEWARDYNYPLSDPWNLPRVAQFLAMKRDPMFPKDEIVSRFRTVVPPDFDAPGEPHGVLADLPLPIYITTNYDDFMTRALRSRHRNPSRELCRWNSLVRERPSVFDPGSDVEVSVANPVVFHLFGYDEVPESLVLTEDDYLDFLVSISRDPQIIPRQIEKALASTSLLPIGYSLVDWGYRIISRGLIGSLERSLGHIPMIVIMAPEPPETEGITQEQVQQYLADYLAQDDVRPYWGTTSDFIQELKERWEAFDEDS